jgi:DNA-directed RNA polymerase subunit beta'
MLALMQGSGFTTDDKGNGKLRLKPFTDKGLSELNPKELTNAEIVSIKDMKPVEGGLFDPAMQLTNKWGKITLSEPIINPPFENQVASLLGIKKSDIEAIIKGEKDLANFGTGSEALKKALASIDMRTMFNKAVKDFKEGPKSGKQKALNRMNYIKGLYKNNLKPEDLMITAIPVIPSAFRPYAMMGDTFIPGDANELYQELFNVNAAHKELKQEIGENLARENAINLYKAAKALYGVDEPENKKLKQRGVSGFMNKLVGATAKFSYPQRVLNSKTVDFSGRAVAGPNPDLGIDEIGVPYDIAWKIFSPYIQRELSRTGMSMADAVTEIEKKSEKAKQALERVVNDQYVIYSRDPSWHKFNLLAAKAKLPDGKNLLVNPLVSTGLNLDYDGDDQLCYVFTLVPKN